MSDRSPAGPPHTAHKSHGRGIPGSPIQEDRTEALPAPQDVGPESGSATGPPRWVTVVVSVVAALVLLGLVLLHVSGGLGPGLHGGN